MDPSTAAAIAAVAIAVLAFIVAFAQVLQQYFMTGSLLRLCDSVVYGPLPGRGRRVWQSGQFRFRVIYTLPQLRLEKSLWDGDDDDDVHLHEYPFIEEWSDRKFSPRSSIGRMCTRFGTILLRPWHYVSRIARYLIRSVNRIVHRGVQTSVAPNFIHKGPSLWWRRTYSIYHAFWSSFKRSIKCRIDRFQESSVGYGSRGSSASDLLLSSNIDIFKPTGKQSGAASWASFTWIAQRTCHASLRFEIAEGDADRCPSDLPNVPMQVSLRDIIILGLQTGMEVTSPYIDIETGNFSMVGRAGSFTCSKHPILGSLLHFAPSGFDAGHNSLASRDQRKINKLWVLRANDCAPIAGRAYTRRERAHLNQLDGEWVPATRRLDGFESGERRNRRGVQRYTQYDHDDRKTTHSESKKTRSNSKQSKKTQSGKSAFRRRSTSPPPPPSSSSSSSSSWKVYSVKSQDIDCHDVNTTHDERGRALPVNETPNPVSQPSTVPLTEVDDDISIHQASRLDDSLVNGDEAMLSKATGIAPESGSNTNGNSLRETDSTQAGDSVRMVYQSPSHASKENIELVIVEGPETSRFNATNPDKTPEKRGQRESLLSTSSSKATTTPPVLTRDREKVSNEGHDRRDLGHTLDDDTGAEGPKFIRDVQQEVTTQPRHRERRRTFDHSHIEYNQPYDYRRKLRRHADAHWKWFSQMDIMHGYWATPWESVYSMKGYLSAIMEALSTLLNKRNLRYISPTVEVEEVLEWASRGRSTWPMYAINARGGVTVQENKTKIEFPGFASKIAAVELFHDHRWQVERYTELTQTDEKLAELMMLDSWLSICGREPEILNGASDLRHNMPLLIQFMFEKFEERFENLDRTANEGGLQHIQSVARSLLATLDDEKLSVAEETFTIVAMLRTAKVASCISSGPYTWDICEILYTDTRVWLV